MFDPHNNHEPGSLGKLKTSETLKSRCVLISHVVKAMWDGEYPDRPHELISMGIYHVDGSYGTTMAFRKRDHGAGDVAHEHAHFKAHVNRAAWMVQIREPTVESEKVHPPRRDIGMRVDFIQVPANSYNEEKQTLVYDEENCNYVRAYEPRSLPRAATDIYHFFISRYDEFLEQEKALSVLS